MKENAGRGYEVVRRVLAEDGWEVKEKAEGTLTSSEEGELCPIQYYFRLIFDRCQFLFYIVPHIDIPDYLMADTAEYLCRVNSGMRIGCFELDFNNRHVRFKSSIEFGDAELSPPLVRGVIKPALDAYDEYFEGLARVLAGVAKPLEAINDIDYGAD